MSSSYQEEEVGMTGKCALCGEEARLQESHIIPKFVIRYLKTSAPSAIRSNRAPNRRIQDGEKLHLLCRDCEQLFSGWEKTFAENLFVPLHNPSPVIKPLPYRQWALKFAVSVSWRVLLVNMMRGLKHFTEQQQASANQALEVWRSFLLGKVKNPGRFEQHLLPLDVIESHTTPDISPFLNRYLLRVVQADVPTYSTSAITFTKLCRVLLVGFIDVDDPLAWRGTKLHVNRGEIRPRHYMIPGEIGQYMNEKADQTKNFLSSLSPEQDRKVDQSIQENLDALANSEIFRAMSYDVTHSGKSAFKAKKGDAEESKEL